MQHEERFGREVYTNFSTEIEKFRRGEETYILLEFENAWKFGSLFSVQDADGSIRVSSHIGTMQIDYPKGLGKTYTRQEDLQRMETNRKEEGQDLLLSFSPIRT